MIYSGIQDNWTSLVIMHSVARNYFESTRGTEYRGNILGGEGPFPFDCQMYDSMTKESCIVGMVMVWAMVTLETLVNHTIAEKFVGHGVSKDLVAQMIETPKQITCKAKLKVKSDLAHKIYIAGSQLCLDTDILVLADKLSFVRNSIVHDKPFNLVSHPDGDVEVEWYNSKDEPRSYRYDDLEWYFDECDKIVEYISELHCVTEVVGCKLSFSSLLN